MLLPTRSTSGSATTASALLHEPGQLRPVSEAAQRPRTMDLMQASSVDPAALKEDAARAKEMVAIISHAKKAEDRRERLMKNAKTPSQVRTLEKRFVVERRQDAQRIRDLSQEREDLLRVSLARHAGAPVL